MTDFQKSIGRRIKEARESAGLTQRELGDRIGVVEMTVSRYERGVNQPTIEGLSAIADALGVSLVELLPNSGLTAPDAEMVA